MGQFKFAIDIVNSQINLAPIQVKLSD